MRFKRPLTAQALLLVSFLGAFGFLRYFSGLQILLLSELCVVALVFGLSIATRIDSRWVLYVLLPTVALGCFVAFYAYIFTLRTGSPFIPSVLAQRRYVFLLLGPVIYMLYLRGWRLADFQRPFVAAAAMTVVAFVLYDLVAAPSSILLSGRFFDPRLEAIYGTDHAGDLRSIKTSSLFLFLYLLRRVFLSTNVFALQFRLGAAAVCFALFAFGMPRGLLASLAAAVILYAMFLYRPERVGLIAFATPLLAVVCAAFWTDVREAFVNTFLFDPSYQVRTDTTRVATEYFLEYPWFGFGQDSRQAISFLELFGENFYPSDIGILGVAFQFGIVGVALYLAAVAWLCVGLIRLLWAYADRLDLAQRAFLWALFLVCLTFFLATPLQARFIFGEGLFIGAFVWGLMMTHTHSLSTKPKLVPRQRPKPAAVGVGR